MKKDLDYIATLEKVLAETYGKNSVQDFRATWEPQKEEQYLEQLKDAAKKSASKNSKDQTKNILRTCPVCKTYSFSIRDDLYMNRFKCCYDCYIDFAKSHPERWSNGWRPPQEEIKKFLLLRRRNNG